MTKQERTKLVDEGKTILRPQWDQRKNCWKIAKYAKFGGWKRFGGAWYFSSAQALEKIDMIVYGNPELYVKEG